MSWVVHSTVPYPMLKEHDTPRMLSDSGVGPEIYLSGETLDAITPVEAETVSETLRDAEIRSLSFHAPFEDVRADAVEFQDGYSSPDLLRLGHAVEDNLVLLRNGAHNSSILDRVVCT